MSQTGILNDPAFVQNQIVTLDGGAPINLYNLVPPPKNLQPEVIQGAQRYVLNNHIHIRY